MFRKCICHVVTSEVLLVFAALGLICAPNGNSPAMGDNPVYGTEKTAPQSGIHVVLGLENLADVSSLLEPARRDDRLVYFQSPSREETAAVREAAEAAKLLGRRVFVDEGDYSRIHLAGNLAGSITVSASAAGNIPDRELLRVLHPGGAAVALGRRLVKPFPEGTDSWSHFFHGPDNNPQSTDQLARAPYLTQFLAEPLFCPMPATSAAAGGRVFRAFGHLAHKANQNAMLNTLICSNGFNGAILWQRPLSEGFMIHRNTMIATPETLYVADDHSCKLIDAATGEVRDEIVVPDGIADGTVWKWTALVDGVLYALVGGPEVAISTQRSETPGLGHWPWGLWQGHEYADPKTNFGFGRTFVAIDPETKKLLWSHREEEYVDSRGVCMGDGRIYFYAPGKFLGCLDAAGGEVRWKNSDADLINAIGPDGRAQDYVQGYSTTAYVKCNASGIYFAGPQRPRLVAASTRDGRLLWQKDEGNYQLVLRDDGLYAAGPQMRRDDVPETGVIFDYATGDVLGRMPMRRACTRATGTIDSIFYRATGGTVRFAVEKKEVHHIAPMRPACQDGVIVSDGHLYWGPWMCGCQLSLYGHICLAPAGDFDFHFGADDSRLTAHAEGTDVAPLEIREGDWPTYMADNARTCMTNAPLPTTATRLWRFELPSGATPTAPVTAGGLVFFGDRSGAIMAVRAEDGTLAWKARTGGPIFFPPAIEAGRLFAGSADGRVYAFEAATGRPLWTFRLAPAERWIPVYGKLISTWPVAGGVVVQDGTVYAAAGIAHYDGTHVAALDAATGTIRWYNDRSGTTSEKADHGVSLQGPLAIAEGELRFLGGGVHEVARYDLAGGRCLNEPFDLPRSVYHTAFSAYFPEYGRYSPLNQMLPDGRWLVYDVTYEGSQHGRLALLPAVPQGDFRTIQPISRWGAQFRPRRNQEKVWEFDAGYRFNGFAISNALLLAAGHAGADPAESVIGAIGMDDGKPLWHERLGGPVVRDGLAVDSAGRAFVALERGEVVRLGAK